MRILIAWRWHFTEVETCSKN